MRFWVGVTDNEWFDFLRKLSPDEVNFWRPSGKDFSVLEPGGPFLFKLHSPLAVLPTPPMDRPNAMFLEWHNERVFRAG